MKRPLAEALPRGAGRRPARRLKVAMLIDALEGGGAERFLLDLATRIDRRQFEVLVCSTRGGPWSEQVALLAEHGVPSLLLGRRRRTSLAAWLPLVRALRAGRVDVLHAHKHGSNLWGSVIGRLSGTPVVIATEHSWSYEGQPVRRLLDRHVVGRLATAFVAVSERDRRHMIDLEGIPARKTRLLRTGIALHPEGSGGEDPRAARRTLGVPVDAPIIGTVGALRPLKALPVLLRAHQLVRQARPTAHLVIAGEGPERSRLEALTAELGLAGHVHFLGHRRDIDRVLAAVDVFAMSSDSEGSPLALLEAMAAAKPVVATAVGGLPEMAPHGECALLVPRRDPPALAAAILRLLGAETLRRTLAIRARTRAAECFPIERVVDRWQSLYLELREEVRVPG